MIRRLTACWIAVSVHPGIFNFKPEESKAMKITFRPGRFPVFLAVGLIWAGCATLKVGAGGREGASNKLVLLVQAGETDGTLAPVSVVIELPEFCRDVPLRNIAVTMAGNGGRTTVPGQVVLNGQGQTELWWVIPQVQAGERSDWVATFSCPEDEDGSGFTWVDTPGRYRDLLVAGQRVLRYMYGRDTSTPERVKMTNKPFHHFYDPDGEQLLTNGDDPTALYPHHRGLFIGWTRVHQGEKTFNFWAPGDQWVVSHEKFIAEVAGPVLARSQTLIHWNDENGQPVVIEERQITAYRQDGANILLLEFRTMLTAANGDIFLDGDPEHGGFQYRAHPDVAREYEQGQHEAAPGRAVKASYHFHEEGIDPREVINLPWVAMNYDLKGRRYAVQHMNDPANPDSTYYSAYRDYGRFGAFFKKALADGESISLRYGIAVTRGMTPDREAMAERYAAFAKPPKVVVR